MISKNMSKKNELIIAEEGEYYARVDKAVGNGKFNGVYISETGPRNILLNLRGSLKRKKKKRSNLIESGCWVLIVIPDYDTTKGWIVSKYQDNEVNTLKKMGEITDIDKGKDSKTKKTVMPDEETGIVFENDEQDTEEVSDDAKKEVQPLDEDDSDSSLDMDAI